MEAGKSIDSSHCEVCGRRLRNAVFCSACGESLCSWECYTRHLAQHPLQSGFLCTTARTETEPTGREESPQNDESVSPVGLVRE
jgi:hypothetical protein